MNTLLNLKNQEIEKQWLYDFDQCLKMLEKQTRLCTIIDKDLHQKLAYSSNQNLWLEFQRMGNLLITMSWMDNAIDFHQKAIELINHNKLAEGDEQNVSMEFKTTFWQTKESHNYRRIGHIQMPLGRYKVIEKKYKDCIGQNTKFVAC